MALRTGHGLGKGQPRIEVLPPDELPKGPPCPAEAPAEGNFDGRGKFAQGNKISSKGGKSRAGQTRLASRLGLAKVVQAAAFEPYRRAALDFRKAHVTTLAKTVGGGTCGPAPASVVATAALQLAASRYLFDKAAKDDDPVLFTQASRLANDSRQNLLAAHELCAREAQARPQLNSIERLNQRLGIKQ